jgi:hypothetical protein
MLHVDGFHEAKLRNDGVRLRVGDVKALVNLAKKMLKAYHTQIAVAGSASTVNTCEYTGLAMQHFHKSLKLITMLNI